MKNAQLSKTFLPSQGSSLHGSSITDTKPEQLTSFGSSLHGQSSPPLGAGLSQTFNFLLIPEPHTSLHSEKDSSRHPPSTKN